MQFGDQMIFADSALKAEIKIYQMNAQGASSTQGNFLIYLEVFHFL
jgi:hypothetical protein